MAPTSNLTDLTKLAMTASPRRTTSRSAMLNHSIKSRFGTVRAGVGLAHLELRRRRDLLELQW